MPEWLCRLLTKHRLAVEWAWLDLDKQLQADLPHGETCLCRRYGVTYRHGKLIEVDHPPYRLEERRRHEGVDPTARLDELERLRSAATPVARITGCYGGEPMEVGWAEHHIASVRLSDHDGAYIAALWTEAPALIAAARESQRLRAALERITTEHHSYDDPTIAPFKASHSDYDRGYATGIIDGHRCAGNIARAALAEPTRETK